MRTIEDLKRAFADPKDFKNNRGKKPPQSLPGKVIEKPYFITTTNTVVEERVIYRDKPLSDTEDALKRENERLNALVIHLDEQLDRYISRYGRI